MANPWFRSNAPLWLTAVVSGLIATMLIAVLAPEIFDREGPGWVLSLAGGLIVAAAIIVWGYAKRRAGTQEDHQPTE